MAYNVRHVHRVLDSVLRSNVTAHNLVADYGIGNGICR